MDGVKAESKLLNQNQVVRSQRRARAGSQDIKQSGVLEGRGHSVRG